MRHAFTATVLLLLALVCLAVTVACQSDGEDTVSFEQFEASLPPRDAVDHKALWGFFMQDEPNASSLPEGAFGRARVSFGVWALLEACAACNAVIQRRNRR